MSPLLGGKDSLRVANLSGGGALCSEWVDAEGTGGTFWDGYGRYDRYDLNRSDESLVKPSMV